MKKTKYIPRNTNKTKIHVPRQTPKITLEHFKKIGGLDYLANIMSMQYLLNTVSGELNVVTKELCDRYGLILGNAYKFACEAEKAMSKYIDEFADIVRLSKPNHPDVYTNLNNDIARLKDIMFKEFGLSDKFEPKC